MCVHVCVGAGMCKQTPPQETVGSLLLSAKIDLMRQIANIIITTECLQCCVLCLDSKVLHLICLLYCHSLHLLIITSCLCNIHLLCA